MIKIMLVEDDKSLREIYGVRLLAEGYDIVSAGDGEEALAMAIKERPQLIVSDVMMPKISGFDMLDILRSTTETKNIKVIMMTALSSEEQRSRGESLGADRYLVKSQVGIEDVVRVVHEVLGDTPSTAPAQAAPQSDPKVNAPVQPTPQTTEASSASDSETTSQPSLAPTPQATPEQSSMPQPQPLSVSAPVAPAAPTPAAATAPSTETPKPPSIKTRIIQPLGEAVNPAVDFSELLDKELAKEAGVDDTDRPEVATTEQEKAFIDNQINQFAQTPAQAAPAPEEFQNDLNEQPSLPDTTSNDDPTSTSDNSGTSSDASDQGDDDVPEVNISEDGSFKSAEPETETSAEPSSETSAESTSPEDDKAIAEAILAAQAPAAPEPETPVQAAVSEQAGQPSITQDITSSPAPVAPVQDVAAPDLSSMPRPTLPETPTLPIDAAPAAATPEPTPPTRITISTPTEQPPVAPEPQSQAPAAPDQTPPPPQTPPPLPPVPPRA